MIYYWYDISTGMCMGHSVNEPTDEALSYTTEKPPARDPDTQDLRWTGTEWELVDAS